MNLSARAIVGLATLAVLLLAAVVGTLLNRPSGWVAELHSHPGCYVDATSSKILDSLWVAPLPDTTVTWTGACSGAWAEGPGVLTVDSRNAVMVYDGVLTGGIEQEGRWVEFHDDGHMREIPYVNGRVHGTLVVRLTNSSGAEIPYVNGQLHGTRVERESNGTVTETPYVDGQKHGMEVTRWADGGITETPWANGQIHGTLVSKRADGTVTEVPYINGDPGGRPFSGGRQ